jgi:hypothetical protein
MQRFERSKVPPPVFRDKQFSAAREERLEFFALDARELSQAQQY